MRRVRNHAFLWASLFLLLWAISLPKPGNVLNESGAASSGAFRPGDVGKSLVTPKGVVWIYGDSWHAGYFIRNAVTLNGKYTGTIAKGMPPGRWMWLAAPFVLPSGKLGAFGSEMMQNGSGMWGFKRVGQVYVEFDPANPEGARVTRIDKTSTPWSSASSADSSGPLVYTIDSKHHPRVGRPSPDGTVDSLATLKAQLSGQFSVLKDNNGRWWMVGLGIMLSRKLWAYPLAGPQGPINGKKVLLTTLPSPGENHYVYHANIHPEEGGLLTWAINGKGAGEEYGLRRMDNFWPAALGAAQDNRTDPAPDEADDDSADTYAPGD